MTKALRGGWHRVVQTLRSLKEPFQVCFEASCGYGPLYEALARIARRVVWWLIPAIYG